MSIAAESLDRAWVQFKGKVKEKADVVKAEQHWNLLMYGAKRASLGVIFLWMFRLVTPNMDFFAMLLPIGLVFTYVMTRKIDEVWIPFGIAAGAFFTATFVIPFLVVGEKAIVLFASFLGNYHAAGDNLFLRWKTIGLMTVCVWGVALLPYCFKKFMVLKNYTKANKKRILDEIWTRQEIIPHYHDGMRLLNNDQTMSVKQRDEIAAYWAELDGDTIDAIAFLVSVRRSITLAQSLQAVNDIHNRSMLRIESQRYQLRKQKR